MKKYHFLLIFIIIFIIGTFSLWKTGTGCNIYISYRINWNFDKSNDRMYNVINLLAKEQDLMNQLVPRLCSQHQFYNKFNSEMDEIYKYYEHLKK